MTRVLFGFLIALGGPLVLQESRTPAPPPSCPPGLVADADRTERLSTKLRTLGRPPLSRPACFGTVPVSAITPEGTMLLDARSSDAALASRTLHLTRHAEDPALFAGPRRGEDCAGWLAAVLRAEAEAYAVELDALRALREPVPYAFGDAYFAAKGDPTDVVLRFLVDHPDGGGGVDGLASGYRQRCVEPH